MIIIKIIYVFALIVIKKYQNQNINECVLNVEINLNIIIYYTFFKKRKHLLYVIHVKQ